MSEPDVVHAYGLRCMKYIEGLKAKGI